jgi:hypothetical protein
VGTELQGYGINIYIVRAACAIADGAFCVRVAEENPSGGSACAESTNKATDATGTVTTSHLIRVRDDSWSQAYLNWLMMHEFGHLFGIDDPQCGTDDTVMYEYQSQCNQFPSGTYTTVPSPSDAHAAATSGYQGGGQSTCPPK